MKQKNHYIRKAELAAGLAYRDVCKDRLCAELKRLKSLALKQLSTEQLKEIFEKHHSWFDDSMEEFVIDEEDFIKAAKEIQTELGVHQ